MVAVVATQELKAEDFLLRFEAEASQDDIHGIGSISARPVFGNCCYGWDSSHLYVVLSAFFSLVHVFCFPSDDVLTFCTR